MKALYDNVLEKLDVSQGSLDSYSNCKQTIRSLATVCSKVLIVLLDQMLYRLRHKDMFYYNKHRKTRYKGKPTIALII